MDPTDNENATTFILEDFLFDEADDQMAKMILEKWQRASESETSNTTTRKRRYFNRDREVGHQRLFNDYFADNPVYPESIFRRRFRMSKSLFLRIVEALKNHSKYFQLRVDATGKKGLSPLQKMHCGYSTIGSVVEIFGPRYLRKPSNEDVQRLLRLHEERHGFPGMLGSIDCMHWKWKNCPAAWKGQFTRGDQGAPTIMLEAVASADLWIWHAFFGVAGSNNDINVLNQSPLFNDVLHGYAPEIYFNVNGTTYTKGYYLADGIYPEWATFVKSFSYPQDPKRLKFKEMQEAARKDVERAFGVLQSRWAIVRGPARFLFKKNLKDIMYTCIILHNMIVEDECDNITTWYDDEEEEGNSLLFSQGYNGGFDQYMQRNAEVRDREEHHQLRSDLVEHIWNHFTNTQDENH